MSARMTRVEVPSGEYLIRGHIGSEAAIEEFQRYLEELAVKVAAQLADLEAGNATVYHQNGVTKATRVHEVLDDYGWPVVDQ